MEKKMRKKGGKKMENEKDKEYIYRQKMEGGKK